MFKKRHKFEDEFEIEEWEDWDQVPSFSRGFPSSLIVVVGVIVVLVAVLGGWLFFRSRTPVYAAEDWFNAMWELDSPKVLDRTCDKEIWVSNAVASGSSITGLVEYLDITHIPGLDSLIIPGVDLNALKDSFEIDRSNIAFEEMMNDGTTAVVVVQGQLRFRVLGGWYPYRLDDMWLFVQEDARWKWCGQHF